MNYWIQGDAAKAEEIKAAFERLGYDTSFVQKASASDSHILFTLPCDTRVHAFHTAYIEADILKRLVNIDPDYQELELPIELCFDEYGSHYCSAPTQQMVCDWLTEEKGMYISVVPDFNEYGEYPDDLYWFARVYDLIKGDYIHSTKLCISSQEAFETAIQYVLTNLI